MAYDAAGSAWMLAHVFIDVAQWKNLDSMAALFVAGLFLALVRERTGHIGGCVGLHAGWVLVIQVTRQVTDGDPDSELSFLVGVYDGTIGWLATAWIGALATLYWIWSSPANRRQGPRGRVE
jgi:membrane protease YdiL (CAAX protease family)